MLDSSSEKTFFNILIIDDEPFILDILSHYLANQGFNVQVASNDIEAIKYLSSSHFDLVLTDVVMKTGDFSNFLIQVKTLPSTISGIPIIAVTGKPNFITDEQKIQSIGILEKPFTPDELIQFIKSNLSLELP